MSVTGWRALTPDPRHEGRILGVDTDGRSEPAKCRLEQLLPADVVNQVIELQQSIGIERHQTAPHPRCYCGYRIVHRVDSVLAYMWRTLSPGSPLLLADVESYGTAIALADCMFSTDDPPDTTRVEGFTIRSLTPVGLTPAAIDNVRAAHPRIPINEALSPAAALRRATDWS